MLAGKEGGQWKKYSTAEVKDMVDKLSAGLLSMGISGGDMSHEGSDIKLLMRGDGSGYRIPFKLAGHFRESFAKRPKP